MTPEEIVHSLNCCFGFGTCEECTARGIEHDPLPCKMSCKESLGLFAADLIEQQAARIAELEAEVPRWIPVEERLPEVHQNTRKSDAMLVYTRRKLFMVAVWNGIDWLAPMDFWDAWGDEIVYWMPLPEAPKEGT